MKILLLNWRDIKHPAGGGAEVWGHRVAEGLIARGHSVTFFAAHVDGQPEQEEINGVTVVRRGSRFGVYRAARNFYRSHRNDFDVILEEINTRPFFAASWGDTPVVPMIHQVAKEVWKYEMPWPVSWVGRYIMEPRWLRRIGKQHVMTLSPSSADSLREYGVRDSTVVVCGADDCVVESHEKTGVPTVVFLGRLVQSKRPDHAVEAFRILKSRVPDARMWIMGSGPMQERLRKMNVPGVEILGYVSQDERRRRLTTADVLVTTTVREGWGLNVAEAAAAGTPTIGYDSFGLRDSIPAAGGRVTKSEPQALGNALVDFFQGKFTLTPRIGTLSWDEVCIIVEGQLQIAVRASQA